MELNIPPPEKVPYGLRAMKTVALAGGELDETERALMEAAQDIFRVEIDIDLLTPISPEELAVEFSDPQLRWQLCHGLIVMSLADGEPKEVEWKVVRAFADALEVESGDLDTLRKLANAHFMAARLDVARHFFLRAKVVERMKQDGITWLAKSVAALAGIAENSALGEKYRGLQEYPENSLGKRYFEFIRSNGFNFPGERGGAPEPVILHDLTHTLGDYGTDPQGELEVNGFHAGFRKDHPFTWIFFGMMQFHLGVRVGLLAKGKTGHFDPKRMLKAVARGAAMNIDLTDDWDPWTVMDKDIDELRSEYGIAPKD